MSTRLRIILAGAAVAAAVALVWFLRSGSDAPSSPVAEAPKAAAPPVVGRAVAVEVAPSKEAPPPIDPGAPGAPMVAPAADPVPDAAPAAAAPGDAKAVERYLARATPAQKRLMANLARANIDPPPQLSALFEMQKQGASPDALLAFMQREFPRNLALRVHTVEWIESLEPGGRKTGTVDIAKGGRQPLGTIEPAPPRTGPAQSPP